MDNFKKCSTCGEVKLLDCFYMRKKSVDGYQYRCKKCMLESANKWHANNPEKVKAKQSKWDASNPEKVKAKQARYTLNLNDALIKQNLKKQTGVPYEHIAQDLIEAKRLQILIQRKLKELTK